MTRLRNPVNTVITIVRALLMLSLCAAAGAQNAPIIIVEHGEGIDVADLAGVPFTIANAQPSETHATTSTLPQLQHRVVQHSTVLIGRGDFRLDAMIMLDRFDGRNAALTFDGGAILLDAPTHEFVLRGALFGGGTEPLGIGRSAKVPAGVSFALALTRMGASVVLSVNGEDLEKFTMPDLALGRVGFDLGNGNMRVLSCTVEGDAQTAARPFALFSAADGEVDEHRDPVIAASNSEALALAVAVTTAPDGSVATKIRARTINADGTMSPARDLIIDAVKPDFIAIAHDGSQWVLLVQEWNDAHLVEAVQVYASNDGTRFQRIGEAQSKSQAESQAESQAMSQAMRLAPTALVRHPSGTLMAYASRVIDGAAQSASVVQQSDGSWLVRERHADENVAAKKVAAAWGGPAGTACCASLAGMSLQVFEGGDASPREHVLCVRVPAIVSVPAVK